MLGKMSVDGVGASTSDVLVNMLKGSGGGSGSNPLLTNPAALLSLANNPIYAVQLAQIQAAQISLQQQLAKAAAAASEGSDLSGGLRKRKMENVSEVITKATPRGGDSPLDLSGNSKAKLAKTDLSLRGEDFASPSKLISPGMASAWAGALPFLNPFLSGGPGATSPRSPPSSSSVIPPSMPKNPLEHMSEIAKTGGSSKPPARHSAWQSQWINRGPENTKDIFKCTCCRDSFPTLQALTLHMRETGHYQQQHGGITSPRNKSPPDVPKRRPLQHPPIMAPDHHHPPHQATPPPPTPPKRDILKEQLPLPRKLVRGQDVWLGKGEEQTKNILKCMYCQQSFRSLDNLTVHMQETKHYTKVISQEQISSWKSNTGNTGNRESPGGGGQLQGGGGGTPRHANEQINAVLTCKVCNEPFQTLKHLSEHMVKNNHYAGGSSGDFAGSRRSDGPPSPTSSSGGPSPGSRRPAYARYPTAAGEQLPATNTMTSTGTKKTKSLPVKTLLEMERMQKALNSSTSSIVDQDNKPPSSSSLIPSSMQDFLLSENNPFLLHQARLRNLAVASSASAASADLRSSPSPTDNINRRPDSCRSSSASSAGGGGGGGDLDNRSSKSSNKSILGSLEDMVQHNFVQQKQHTPPIKASPPPPPSSASPPKLFSINSLLPKTGPGGVDDDDEGDSASSPPSAANDKPPSKTKSSGNKNPLAALQDFCESTEKPSTKKSSNGQTKNSFESPALGISDPGSILAFSWACNQAVVDDSVFKCPFCETPFVSKGAYRHHLSKVHFMKSDKQQQQSSAEDKDTGKESSGNKEEESEDKYHKYAELAKQLSSKSSSSPAGGGGGGPLSTKA